MVFKNLATADRSAADEKNSSWQINMLSKFVPSSCRTIQQFFNEISNSINAWLYAKNIVCGGLVQILCRIIAKSSLFFQY